MLKSKENRQLEKKLQNVLGIKPGNYSLYYTALSHRSVKENSDENNERLEYLGDAVLSTVIADYLFKRYPYKGEGFLTEMRSKMVNRQQLNEIALKMGVKKLTLYNKFDNFLKGSQIFGNTLEALVGAVYLDKGYLRCKKFVIDKLIQPYFDLEVVVNSDTNHKSKVIEWAQRNSKEIKFEITESRRGRTREFSAQVIIGGESFGLGYGHTKKKAEQDASEKTCVMLNI